MRLYIDVETYRPDKDKAFTGEKIIVIGVIEDRTPYDQSSASIWDPPPVKTLYFKEWELGGEREVVIEFYNYLRGLVDELGNRKSFIVVNGFNILRYDIPLLIQKGVEYGIGSLGELNALWHNTLTVDYMQVFLCANGMRFRGLKLQHLARIAKEKGIAVPTPHGSGEDVRKWYEDGKFDDIIRHIEADLRILRMIDLNHKKLLDESDGGKH